MVTSERYAVMEKTDSIYVISDNVGWSDLGSWSAVRDHLPHDLNGNAVVGDVVLSDCRNCVAHVEKGGRRIVVNGLDSCIISEHDGFLLVSSISQEQHIKEAVKSL